MTHADVPADSIYRQLLEHGQEIDVPVTWRKFARPEVVYLGECLPRTFRFLQLHATAAQTRAESFPIEHAHLVHGTMRAAKRRAWLRHAWVELPGDIVFDGVVQRFYRRDSYYSIIGAHALAEYSWTEARQLASTPRRPYGPWHRRVDHHAKAP